MTEADWHEVLITTDCHEVLTTKQTGGGQEDRRGEEDRKWIFLKKLTTPT